MNIKKLFVEFNVMWILSAVLSAFFAGITAILTKYGVRKINSDVATVFRTVVVCLFSWLMVFIVGSYVTITSIQLKSWIFLVLSGVATGISWICYFKALSVGDVNKVTPIDKSSTVLSILFAIVLFGETSRLAVKLTGTALIAVGTYLMIEKQRQISDTVNGKWFIYAILSAVFASLTSVFAKVGIEGVESNLATAIRTIVVLVMACLVVVIKGEKLSSIKDAGKKEIAFILLSGVATGCSWLCYYYAIQKGLVSVVVPVDKMSIVVTVFFSWIVFKEKLSKKAFLGLCLICVGTLMMAIWT